MPNRVKSTSVDIAVGLTHPIQEFHDSLQIRLFQALDVQLQALVVEESEKEWAIVGVGGVELLEPLLELLELLDVRNRL